jgi:hypothetical protein
MVKTRKNYSRRNKRHCKTKRGAGWLSYLPIPYEFYSDTQLDEVESKLKEQLNKEEKKQTPNEKKVNNLKKKIARVSRLKEIKSKRAEAKENPYSFERVGIAKEQWVDKQNPTNREKYAINLQDVLSNNCLNEQQNRSLELLQSYCNQKNYLSRKINSKCRLVDKINARGLRLCGDIAKIPSPSNSTPPPPVPVPPPPVDTIIPDITPPPDIDISIKDMNPTSDAEMMNENTNLGHTRTDGIEGGSHRRHHGKSHRRTKRRRSRKHLKH